MYVHVPFCDHICAYCDFMRCGYHAPLVDQWLKAIQQELQEKHPSPCKSIYIGGGTPSALNARQLIMLLEALQPYTQEVEEYTMEANADSLDEEKIKICQRYGINRISMGAQTFQPALLQRIERIADRRMVETALHLLHKGGISNISLDLLYGLPGQTMKQWQEDLQIAINLPITHLSLYALTIEEHAKFGREHVPPCAPDVEADFYEEAQHFLKQAGFEQYEISSFAKDGHYSKHNMAYWHYDDFYGIGCGASGKEHHVRYDNTRNLHTYLTKGPCCETIVLDQAAEMFETMMMGLRIKEGVNEARFLQRFGCSYRDVFATAIQKHLALHNLKERDGCLSTTKQGMMLLHEILVDFL